MADLDFEGLDLMAEDESDSALDELLSAHRASTKPPGSSTTGSAGDDHVDHEKALAVALRQEPEEIVGPEADEGGDKADLQRPDDADSETDTDTEPEDDLEQESEDEPADEAQQQRLDQEAEQAYAEALEAQEQIAAGGSELLPVTKFKIEGQGSSQLQVRMMPEVILEALRTTIEDAAVSAGHHQREAEIFASRLSQSALVTALLFSQLRVDELGLADLDASTAQATRMLQRTDPLQAAMLDAFTAANEREVVRDRRLNRLEKVQREVSKTLATLEHMQAFTMVDKQDNIMRGAHTSADIDVADPSVIELRDRTRHQVQARLRREWETEGRKR